MNRLLALTLTFFFSGTGQAGVHIASDPVLIPPTPEWTLSIGEAGQSKKFTLPRDLAQIRALPPETKEKILREIHRIENNQAWVRKLGETFSAQMAQQTHRLQPDYEKKLYEAAISVSDLDAKSKDPLWRHQPLLAALPPQTKIHIITPPSAEAAVRKDLAETGQLKRAVIYPLPAWSKDKGTPTKYSRLTRWIRDTFMVGTTSKNKSFAYFPLAYATTSTLASSDINSIKPIWHDPSLLLTFPAFIRGGNVAVADNTAGERIAFLGTDEIEQNELRFNRTTGLTPPRPLAVEIIKRLADTKKIHVLPNTDQLFHIDMAISFIAPGMAAVLAPLDEPMLGRDESEVLVQYRKTLAAAGFRIVNIPTTTARVNSYQSPVNILPFTDPKTGQHKAIVPEFPDVTVVVDGHSQSLNGLIKKAYNEAGISIVWAEDRLSDRQGNVHCAILGLN